MNIIKLTTPHTTQDGKAYLRRHYFRPLLRLFGTAYWLVADWNEGDWLKDVKLVEPGSRFRPIAWYVYGHYHCDKCPFCWAEWSYEGDGDCGCYIYGDLRESCRLLPPFKWLRGWHRKKRALYWEAHQYDGMAEWYQQCQINEKAMVAALLDTFQTYDITYDGLEGKVTVPDKKEFFWERASSICAQYEEQAHPVEHPSLGTRWKRLLKETWIEKVWQKIAPFLTK